MVDGLMVRGEDRRRRGAFNSPEDTVVLSVNEKSRIQALGWRQLVPSMMPGMSERRPHDYVTWTRIAAEILGSLALFRTHCHQHGTNSEDSPLRLIHMEILSVTRHLERAQNISETSG
jgi:hypothetical protein